MTATTDMKAGVRASSCVGCVRKAFFEGVKAPRGELPKKTMRLFRIRSMQNDAVMGEKADEARALGRDVVLELEIPWGPTTVERPHGIWTAHADYVDLTDHVVIEATGSSDLSPDVRKIRQAAFYAKRMTEITGVEHGAYVFVFDPSTGEDRYVPVNWRELEWDLTVMESDLIEALRRRVAPVGVCSTPYDGPAMFCAYAWTACMPDFQWPPMGRVPADVLEHALALEELNARAGGVKLLAPDISSRKEAIAASLAPGAKYESELEDGRKLQVKVIEVSGSESISLTELTKAGYKLPEELLPFVKQRAGHKRVDVSVRS